MLLQCTCPQLLHLGALLPASWRTGGPPFPFLPAPSLSAQDGAFSIPALAIEGREEEAHIIIEQLEGDELEAKGTGVGALGFPILSVRHALRNVVVTRCQNFLGRKRNESCVYNRLYRVITASSP